MTLSRHPLRNMLASAVLWHTAAGETVFFPFGFLRPACTVGSADDRKRVVDLLCRESTITILGFSAAGILFFAVGALAGSVALALILIALSQFSRRARASLASSLPPSDYEPTLREFLFKISSTTPLALDILALVACGFLAALGLALLLFSDSPVMGTLTFVVFLKFFLLKLILLRFRFSAAPPHQN